MNSINDLTARQPYLLVAENIQTQVASAQVFSFINTRSCEQKPQTCHENQAKINRAAASDKPLTVVQELRVSKRGQADVSASRERALEAEKITLEQIVKVSLEQHLGIEADLALQHLRNILSRDLSYWAEHSNPDAERFKEIKASIEEIMQNPQLAKKMLAFLTKTLGSFQIAAMENNVDFRRAYMFYMHENEKSVTDTGRFFYHADVEGLFPSSYQVFEQGVDFFQQIPENLQGIEANRINIYALLLHHIGKPLDYKSLAMAFAHIDILYYAFRGRDFIIIDEESCKLWSKLAKETGALAKKYPAIKQYYADRNLPIAASVISPTTAGQYFSLARFMTSNTLSIKGFCHYLTMSVMLALHRRDLESVAKVQAMLSDFYKLSASDPIIYSRIAHLLATANIELSFASGTFPGSSDLVSARQLFQKLLNNNTLADMILENKRYGFNLLVRYEDFTHSVGVMPIRVGNEVIHYYFDPNHGITPCFCKEHLVEAIKLTFDVVGVKNAYDSNEINKLTIHAVKLTKRNLDFLNNLQTHAGFRYNQLNKRTLSDFASSNALSNEDWSAFFPEFNKGTKLYNKDFDSIEEDAVYKALKTKTSLIALSYLYFGALQNLPSNRINYDALSSATK